MTAQCSAITNALANKGYNNAKLASEAGLSEQRINEILAGSPKPTQQEFTSIAKVLGLNPNTSHAAQVIAS